MATRQWLKWVGTRGNAVPPKAFSVPSKKNSVPAKVISVPAKNTIAFPPKDFAFPPRKFAELQRTSSTTPPSKSGRKTRSTTPALENRAGKLLQLPPPSNSQIGPENSFNYPPRIHRTSSTTPPRNRAGKLLQLPPLSNSQNFIDYPPRNRAGKLLQLPPLEFTELHRLPPLEIGPENSFNYPPSRIHGTSSTTSFVSGVGGTHWNAALKAFPL